MTGKNRQTLHAALEAELAPVRLSQSRKAAILAAASGGGARRRGGRPWRVGLTAAALCAALDGQEARFALFTPGGEPVELPLDETGGPKWAKLPRKPLVVWAGGGIMDPLLKTLARRGAPTTLVAADATHVLAGRSALEQFLRCGGEMRVRRELTIAAVAANPWSAYGWHFEPDKFTAALREVIDLPVVNVKED